MAKESQVTYATRFKSATYFLTVMLEDPPDMTSKKKQSLGASRLVWRDYTGEWLEDSVCEPTEAKNRVETFKKLLGSEVFCDSHQLSDGPEPPPGLGPGGL